MFGMCLIGIFISAYIMFAFTTSLTYVNASVLLTSCRVCYSYMSYKEQHLFIPDHRTVWRLVFGRIPK